MNAKLAAELAAREISREMERHEATMENGKRDIQILSTRNDEDALRDMLILGVRMEVAKVCHAALQPLAENPPVPQS